jgi:hypothetical protein
MPRSHQQVIYTTINKKTSNLNDTIDHTNLTEIFHPIFYRIFHSTATEYTFFSAVHGTFSKTDHILGHKVLTNARKLK